MVNRQTVEAQIGRLIEAPGRKAAFSRLKNRLPGHASILIVGGAIRNLIIQTVFGKAPPTEDIDLFISGLPDDFSLTGLLNGEAVRPTDLGGIRWHPKGAGVAFDLCLLQDFILLKKYKLNPDLHHLMDCIDFTLNAVIFDVDSEHLHEKNCIASICSRSLDFNTVRFYSKQLTAYRILLIRAKTGFVVSEDVFVFLKHQLPLAELSGLKALFTKKLGKGTAGDLMDDYDQICSFKDYAAYKDFF